MEMLTSDNDHSDMEVDSQDSWIDANEAVLMEVSEDSGAEEEIDLQEINDLLDDEGPPQNHPSHSDSEPAPGPFSRWRGVASLFAKLWSSTFCKFLMEGCLELC
ncbi:Hypothetical protein NTJ_02668 [Nesidiocoris tenuis]|uniref:CTNNB1 binding N-teminal domain-containing protein n=1 Tax=Nesidiocoris tenuis TaxID=355587 RepID=A0ABN7AC39_9HEMI|nr:Hypothetical protein NTJ_02668 [Nesidiocoris tenuis]